MTPYITEREPGALECGRSGQRPPGWGDQTWSLAPNLTPELLFPPPFYLLQSLPASWVLPVYPVMTSVSPWAPCPVCAGEAPREQRREKEAGGVKAWRRAGHVSSTEHRCQNPDQEESAGSHGSSHTTWLQEDWSHMTRKSSVSDLLPNTRRYELVKCL